MREVRKHDVEALYENVKECHKDAPSNQLPFIQHSSLVPRLRPYQSQAVKWMLCRESLSDHPSGKQFIENRNCWYFKIVVPISRSRLEDNYACELMQCLTLESERDCTWQCVGVCHWSSVLIIFSRSCHHLLVLLPILNSVRTSRGKDTCYVIEGVRRDNTGEVYTLLFSRSQ